VIELRDTVAIEADPREVWEWLESMPDHYRQWHPDHRSAAWVRGHGLAPGAVMEVEEVLHGKRHRLRLTCVEVEPGRRIRYRLSPGVGGELSVAASDGGSTFTAVVAIGTRVPVVGPAVDALLHRALGGRFAAIARHQAEEGQNLRALLERGDR
jgi:uncharacterized protein YndB with AHSA1/START domain